MWCLVAHLFQLPKMSQKMQKPYALLFLSPFFLCQTTTPFPQPDTTLHCARKQKPFASFNATVFLHIAAAAAVTTAAEVINQ